MKHERLKPDLMSKLKTGPAYHADAEYVGDNYVTDTEYSNNPNVIHCTFVQVRIDSIHYASIIYCARTLTMARGSSCSKIFSRLHLLHAAGHVVQRAWPERSRPGGHPDQLHLLRAHELELLDV